MLGNGPAFYDAALKAGLEGIVSKRRDATYEEGRSKSWLKVKTRDAQAFVVGGFTVPPSGSTTSIGGLLLGVYDGDRLIFAGGVGTGFTVATSRGLRKALEIIGRSTSPFATEITGQPMARVRFVEPKLVVEVAFSHWTADGKLRHPSFVGVRVDKPPTEVARQRPA